MLYCRRLISAIGRHTHNKTIPMWDDDNDDTRDVRDDSIVSCHRLDTLSHALCTLRWQKRIDFPLFFFFDVKALVSQHRHFWQFTLHVTDSIFSSSFACLVVIDLVLLNRIEGEWEKKRFFGKYIIRVLLFCGCLIRARSSMRSQNFAQAQV